MAKDNYAERNQAVYNFLDRQGLGDQYQLAGGSHLMSSGMGMGMGYGRGNNRALQTAYGLYDLGLLGPGGLMMGGGSPSAAGAGGMGNILDLMKGPNMGDWGEPWAQALQGSLDIGKNLGREENLRRDQALGLMQNEAAIANAAQRGMTPEEINMRMGRVSDVAMGESLGQMRGLREALGSSGVTGGGSAMGMAAGVELNRLAQLQGGKRDIAIAETERRSQAAADRYMRSMGIAQFMAQGPSTKEQESYNAVMDFLANIKLGEKNIEAGKYAARKASQGATTGGLLGLAGSLLGGLF